MDSQDQPELLFLSPNILAACPISTHNIFVSVMAVFCLNSIYSTRTSTSSLTIILNVGLLGLENFTGFTGLMD